MASIRKLPPEAREVQLEAARLVQQDLASLVDGYRQRFGVTVGTDYARELFAQYSASIESKLKFAAAVRRSASRVASAVFAQVLSERGGGMALFTAGGTGVGKTTAIRSGAGAGNLLKEARIIYDSNFHRFESASRKVEMAVKAGSKVVVVFVHRHPVEAYLEGVVPRTLVEGRTVPITGHLRMHRDSLRTFLRVHAVFAADRRTAFMALNNTGHPTEAFPTEVEYLRHIKYGWTEILEVMKVGLGHLYEQGKISQALYKASRGKR
jgi:hypothetical protein